MLNASPWKVTEVSWSVPLPRAGANYKRSFETVTFINLVGGVCVCICVHAVLFQQRNMVLLLSWWSVCGSMVSIRFPGCLRGNL